jgi:protein-serine/threonine kinase
MVDFTKLIFGFKKNHLDSSNQSHLSSPISPHISIASVSPPMNLSKFLPKSLSNVAAPTTAVSNSNIAYGTTLSSNNLPAQQSFLKSLPDNNSNHNLGALSQPAHHQPSAHHHLHGITTGKPGQPVIITTDESGQNVDTSDATHPKGKLKVTIIEGRNLVNSPIHPYVVCTYESSEFVTSTGSMGKSPMVNHHQNPPHQPQPFKNPGVYQRQSMTQHLQVGGDTPVWNHIANFDVVGSKSELDISLYDASRDDAFLGHVRFFPRTTSNKKSNEEWIDLKPRILGETVTGAIKISWEYTSLDVKRTYGPEDFEVLRLLGKGTFGQVFQVAKIESGRIYAMKVLSKKVIVKKKEIAHTIGERNILVRTSAAQSPFIVGLKFSFQTPTDLYLVTDYMSGGELFWHLQKEGRFAEDRAKFYIAELVLALEHLHDNDIVYRDLKPENILLDANGHIALCDFGLSKANLNNDGTTNTFCGTTEYLAPEVLLDETGYTKMVDFWSLGVLIFEMCCGWSPFYADNTQQMYKNIAFGKVRFPKEVLSPEGRSFVKGLLNRNPKHRLGATNDARELRAHPFFNDIDWDLLRSKSIPPPFKPHLTSETDTSNFDPEFTSESTSVLKKQMEMASTPLSPGIQANFKGFTYVDDSMFEDHFGKSHRMNAFKSPGSFIPGNPNLPADEDVIDDDQIDEGDEMEIDHNMDDDEFVSGRFDL